MLCVVLTAISCKVVDIKAKFSTTTNKECPDSPFKEALLNFLDVDKATSTDVQ